MLNFEKYFENSQLNESNYWKDFSSSDTTKIAELHKQTLLAKLIEAGFTDKAVQANILAQVQHESGFIPKNEYVTWSAKGLFSHFGKGNRKGNKVRFNTIQDAQNLINKGPSAVLDKIYGGRMCNTQPGDAIKYRGRGLIQMTGKCKYIHYSEKLGVDLLGSPDLVNDPRYVFDTVVTFFKGANMNKLKNANYATKYVGPSIDNAGRNSRKKTAEKYYKELKTGALKPLNSDKGISTLLAALEGKNIKLDTPSSYTPEADVASIESGNKGSFVDIASNTNTSTVTSEPEIEEVVYFDISKLENGGLKYFKTLVPGDANLA